jgi:hypothetical protein
MRRDDAATLAQYRAQLQREAAAAGDQMAAELRGKADANFVVRRNVARAESSAGVSSSNLASHVAAFGRSDRTGTDAVNVTNGIATASDDLSRRFTAVGAVDAQSARETGVQIVRLEQTRAALYRSIVGEIVRNAHAVARRRGLGSVRFEGPRPMGGVDLTAAIAATLARR